ncbi:hypothetical protein AALP_AA3G004400 [Arabis alpina]|uniref:Uncharacterized protein n=1 Tax=Arabis alpina TaxID=50452 RepID=A0A087H650_ARAAL|nr:hypothetical protein AALP_AA3G004400 [Arabis alpina]
MGTSAPAVQEKDENIVGSLKNSSETEENNSDVSQETRDIQLVSYLEWEKGASYLDIVRRQYKASQPIRGASQKSRTHRSDFLALKYTLRWKRRSSRASKGGLQAFELGSWVTELILSHVLNLSVCESSAEYFELLLKMIETQDALLFLTVRGCLTTFCKLISPEVGNIESLVRSLQIDISIGAIGLQLLTMILRWILLLKITRSKRKRPRRGRLLRRTPRTIKELLWPV